MTFPEIDKRLQSLMRLRFKPLMNVMLSLWLDRPILDILLLDDALHKRHGDYENEGLSMSDLIKIEYGEEAESFISKLTGL